MERCFSLKELMLMMISGIEEVAQAIDQDQVECFLSEIMKAERIFVVGAGRSGFVAKSFAMRLMHCGLTSYVVGETVTPALNKNDTLVAFSGSGKTKSVVEACETTHRLNGRICLITGTEDSPMAHLADCLVYLKVYDDNMRSGSDHFDLRQLKGEHRSISHPGSPAGTLFETSAMVFADSIISALIELKHCQIEDIVHRYTNMQ